MNKRRDQIKWEPKKYCNHIPFDITHCKSHLILLDYVSQNGPQCGFAALSMIASSVNITLHPDDLVLLAKKKSITNYGEMFSAQNMADFAQDILSFSFDIILMSCSIKGLCYQLQKYFDDGSLIMIPYDCDFNNEPCQKNGATAHWAVLCGYIDGGNEDRFYVLACHGKSQYVSAWRFSELQLSNDNLNELDTKKLLDGKNYIVPAGGLKVGIASKWIIFKRKM